MIVVSVARIIPVLGALVLTLSQVAGQVLGAIALDLMAPAGTPLTLLTLVSLTLAFASVGIVVRSSAKVIGPASS